jgi:hypothetical protein
MSTVYEVGTYLGTNVSGLTLGTNLFLGDMPEDPDICATVYESTSAGPIMTGGGTGVPQMEQPNVMLHVRHTSYATGRSLMETCWQTLSKIENENLTNESAANVLYLRVQPLGSPVLLARDEQRRTLFTVNFATVKALSTTV